MGIGEKLIAVMEACRYMPKDGYNKYQDYHYTTAAGLFAKVNAEFVEHGLYIAKFETTTLESRDVTTQKGNTEKYVAVHVEITVGDTESEDKVTFSAEGGGQDAGDKALMKAQTAAKKYAYMGGLNIAMADDPEEDTNTTAYEPKKTQSAKSNGGKCADCGEPIPQNVKDFSEKKYRRSLCMNCQKKQNTNRPVKPADEEDDPF